MKRVALLLLAAVAVLSLTSCGQKAQEPVADTFAAYEIGQVQALAEAGAFSEELEELDADMAFALYRLEDYDLERESLVEAAMLRSAGATCEEGAVLVFADVDAAQKALTALEDYVAGQIETNRDYRPGEIPKLEQAVVSWRGHTLALAVAADVEKAKEVLDIS